MSRRRRVRLDSRWPSYREAIEAGWPSADRTLRRRLDDPTSTVCPVCHRLVSGRFGAVRTHAQRLGTGRLGEFDECPGSRLPLMIEPYRATG